MLVAVTVAVAVVAILNKVRQPDLERLASADDLIEKFEIQVLHYETDGARRRIVADNWVAKWEGPILITANKTFSAKMNSRLYSYLPLLSSLTGLEIRFARQTESGNVQVFYGDDASLLKAYSKHRGKPEKDADFIRQVACFADPGRPRGLIDSVFIGIRSAIYDSGWPRCVLHELVHALGLNVHSDLLRPSVLSYKDHIVDLSLNDKIIIRVLYDDRIQPGMGYDDVMDRVRKIIPELVERVRREGEAALVHPRYRAPQAAP